MAPAHGRTQTFYPIEISSSIEPHFIRFIQLRRCSQSSIATPAGFARSSNGGDFSVTRHFPDSLVPCVANVQRAIGIANDAIRPIELSFTRWPTIATEALDTRAGEVADGLLRLCEGCEARKKKGRSQRGEFELSRFHRTTNQ